MPTPPLPGFFPGNTLLLSLATVQATTAGEQAIKSAVAHDLAMMNHKPEVWHSCITARYAADPVVLCLLEKFETLHYAVKAGVPVPEVNEDPLRAWKASAL